ncbi:hypothetical protein SCLCIDRAFT_250825 [Scleroderma citrinum Foug A]|uniref:Uncharacterized protein n=1 Tax=Scleroderma citrinum Foug A TaxID=1036808 RepID=A0A0C3DJG9_9AGAM|nr:hypothetical protein SCLCIDRAFT_250825 [Scleroderma citrinum Foug A]
MSPECCNTIQETMSYPCSDKDASTIGRHPNFQFSLHAVTSLSSLRSASHPLSMHDYYSRRQGAGGSRKVNIIVAVLEVEGTAMIKAKKGLDAGKEVSILKMILGD